MHIPALILSALRGGSGKTLLSLGLVRSLCRRGLVVQPFKKGPDYIDAAWLSLAAQGLCRNLDPFFLPEERLRAAFCHHAQGADLALIEGNRGLFDGRDMLGTCSTASVACTLGIPVILSLDCTKMTRTSAAVIHGMATFEPGVRIGGVVLNQIATERQASLVRASIEHYTNVPVLGVLPRLRDNPLPERHMGLVSHGAGAESEKVLESIGKLIQEHIDLDRVLALAHSALPQKPCAPFWPESTPHCPASADHSKPRIGYVRDSALWFYYAENLEALERAGAEVVELSVLSATPWPKLDGLYLGGGFPEDVAEALAQSPQLAHIAALSRENLPIYAECGGFMLLAHSIEREGQSYPMAQIFPMIAHFHSKPQGLGYVEARVTAPNIFHPEGAVLRGHEFHYSRAMPMSVDVQPAISTVLQLQAGTGMGEGRDGLLCRQTFASYTHIYAPAVPHWAENFVQAAITHKASNP